LLQNDFNALIKVVWPYFTDEMDIFRAMVLNLLGCCVHVPKDGKSVHSDGVVKMKAKRVKQVYQSINQSINLYLLKFAIK